MTAIEEKIQKVKEMEKEMNEIIMQMEMNYKYRIGDSLIDKDGYPRGDIDVYAVSKSLQRFRDIRVKWNLLRKEVEEELYRIAEKKKTYN